MYMQKINTEKGIQAYEIYNVFQDSKNYVWFGSDGGAWRFDGKQYISFTTANGLPDNVIFGFFEDSKGRIWLKSYNNRIAYIYNNQVYKLNCNDMLSKRKKNELVGSFYVDSGDTIYITHMGSCEMVKIAPPYNETDVSIKSLCKNEAGFIYEVEDGNVITSTLGLTLKKEFILYRRQTKQILRLEDKYKVGKRSACIKQADGSYLIGLNNILYKYDKGELTLLQEFNTSILHTIFDKEHNLWVSTIDDGLFLFRKNDPGYKRPEIYFRKDFANCIIQDEEGAYWIATLKNGLYYVPFNDLQILNSTHGLSENITCAYYDPSENNLLCFGGDNLFFLSQDTVQAKKDICFVPGQPNNIYVVMPLEKDKFLCLGRQSFLFNKTSQVCTPVLYDDSRYKNTIFNSRVGCESGNSIFCSSHVILYKYNPESNKAFPLHTFETKINSISPLDSNNLLVATEGGLLHYDIAKNSTTHVFPFLTWKSVVDIKRKNNRYYILLKVGDIYVADNTLSKITDTIRGAKGCSIKKGYLDNEGVLWLCTNKGIYKIRNDLKTEKIDRLHGLPNDLINDITCDNHYLFVSTDAGLVIFPKNKSFINKTPPYLYCTGININQKDFPLDSAYRLSYNENFIKISYQGLNYRINGDVTCMYKMEGIDEDWKSTKNNTIEYTTLPPGDYDFSMYVLNNDMVRSERTHHIRFTILPPFWKTWWFILGLSIALVVSVVAVFLIRIRQIEKRENEKTELIRKMGHAEMQALRSQMNPHFIFNAINSIQHYIFTNDITSANKYLMKFSKLMRNVLEQSRNEFITLEEETETLRLYLEIESLRFEDKFESLIYIDSTIDPRDVKLSPLIIQPFVENAIWHGLLLKEGKKRLSINVFLKNNTLYIQVDDNGIGRKAAGEYLKNGIKKESLGMQITSERLKLMEEILHVKTSLDVEDKYSSDNKSAGTRVTIKIVLEPIS